MTKKQVVLTTYEFELPMQSTPKTRMGRTASMQTGDRLSDRHIETLDIDIETCRVCGGSMKVIACIEDPLVI